MAVMKSLAHELHHSGKCIPGECAWCEPSPPSEVQDGLSSVGSGTAPASADPLGGESSYLDHRLLTHTIVLLRKWGEDDVAMALTNAALTHDPASTAAAAAGWM